MNEPREASILYYPREGDKSNIPKTVELAVSRIKELGLSKLVVFTSDGVGAERAVEATSGSQIKVIATTFPSGHEVVGRPTGIADPEVRQRLEQSGVVIIRGGMPFQDIFLPGADDIKLVTLVNALKLISGGLQLCVQAVIMACEAGHVGRGEEVVAMAADTAIVVTGCAKSELFSPYRGMQIREIICKPRYLTLTKQRPDPAEPPIEIDQFRKKRARSQQKKSKLQ